MTTIYFAGGEDCDHYQVGGGVVSTTSTSFRSAYARCSLEIINNVSGNDYWENSLGYAGTPTTFWFSCRLVGSSTSTVAAFLKFVDASGGPRLQFTIVSGVVIVQKVNTAGSATTLTNTLSAWVFTPSGAGIADKLDVYWVNAASGSIDAYYNGIHLFNYSGDTTTETTAISGHRMCGTGGGGATSSWSEVIVSDTDTRSMSLQTLPPVANGNTHNFDTGSPAASNVNEIVLNDATIDGSTTAGQIDEYTIPSIVGGTFTIMAIGVSARMQKGTSGPTKMDLVVRSGSTDYLSSDQVLTIAWAAYQNWWTTDPNTSATWTGLPVNIGIQSVT